MKHKRFFNQAFAFPALALIIALAFSVCSNPTGSETKTEPLTEKYTAVKGAKTYELTITQSAANSQAKSTAKTVFTPAAGDSYVLKITENGVTQTSSGTVKAYSNNKFTLASSVNVSVSFEVTINSSGTITNITGTITVQGGVTITGPGPLTPGDGGGDGDGDGDNNGSVTTFTSVAEFETWLNNQAANTESKPYSVILVISDLNGLGTVLKNASDKYVSIDFTGSTFTSIGYRAFYDCFRLTSITIPDSITSIGATAFAFCTSLTSVTFEGTIAPGNFSSYYPFPGDLRDKYLVGGPGTYTSPSYLEPWTKL